MIRPPRLTISESIVVVCIVALTCTLPLQWHQAMCARDCEIVAECHALRARGMRRIASHHAAWMDQFRAQLRRMADEEELLGLRLAKSNFYDERDEDAFYGSLDRKQFWQTFDAVAIREGYQKPAVELPFHDQTDTFEALRDCWPSALALGVLLLFLRRQSRRGRTAPAEEERYWPGTTDVTDPSRL